MTHPKILLQLSCKCLQQRSFSGGWRSKKQCHPNNKSPNFLQKTVIATGQKLNYVKRYYKGGLNIRKRTSYLDGFTIPEMSSSILTDFFLDGESLTSPRSPYLT